MNSSGIRKLPWVLISTTLLFQKANGRPAASAAEFETLIFSGLFFPHVVELQDQKEKESEGKFQANLPDK